MKGSNLITIGLVWLVVVLFVTFSAHIRGVHSSSFYTVKDGLSIGACSEPYWFGARVVRGINHPYVPIVGAHGYDSLGTQEWRHYLDAERLVSLWSYDGILGEYQRLRLLNLIEEFKDFIFPRHSEAEVNAERQINDLIDEEVIDKNTMVIADSGGAHSVAYGMQLVKKLGFVPIILFDLGDADIMGGVWSEGGPIVVPGTEIDTGYVQDLATLLYYCAEYSQLKDNLDENAPLVFILDYHRFEGHYPYLLNPDNLPTIEELRSNGINRVVIITEKITERYGEGIGNSSYIIRYRDYGRRLREYKANGIEIIWYVLNPWEGVLDELLQNP